MKKLLLMFVLALASVGAMQAQNKKGNLLIGTYIGSSGISFGNSKSSYSLNSNISKSDYNSFSIGVGPTIGKYVSDNWVLGTYLGLSFYNSKYDNSNTTSTSTSTSKSHYVVFSAGPYVRYYFPDKNKGKGNGNAYVNFSPSISFYPSDGGTVTYNTSGNNYSYKSKNYVSWSANLNFGYEHYISEVIGLQYYIGYTYGHYSYKYDYDFVTGTDYTSKYENTSSNINFGAGLNIHLVCNKKKK